ncbi:MAG: DUF5723 family protein [Flammeovirgaceae bacterium]
MMRNQYYIVLLLLVTSSVAYGQYNLSTTYYAHNDLNAARYEPSELELGDRSFQFGLNSYVWAGNTSLNFSKFSDLFNGSEFNSSDIDEIVSSFGDQNRFGAGFDLQYGGLAFQIRTKNDKRFDFSFTVVDKSGVNLNLTDDMLDMIWKGNKQFAGKTIDFGDNEINANWWREYAFGAAFPLFGSNGREEGVGMRLGFRAKYIQGLAAIHMEQNRILMTTAADGSSITMDYDYVLNTAGIDDISNFDPFQSNGSGFGLDIGAALFVGPKLEFNASIIDLGSVSYDKQTKTYRKSGVFTYEGQIVSQLFGDVQLQNEASYIFSPDETAGESFDMLLGTKLLLQAEFKTPKSEEREGDKRDLEYVSNAFYVTYIQGLRDVPGATTRPYIAVAYNHDFHKHFDLGTMVGYGGFNQLTLGGFISVNIANFLKIGFGTDNLTPLIIPKSGTGIDGSFNLSISL